MNKKIKNVEELEASSTHPNKFGSKGFALMLVFMVIAFSAFTHLNKVGNVSEKCFQLDISIDNPDIAEVTNSANYTTPMICEGEFKTLCGVCFDDTYFLLDEDGLPDFENNPALKSIVEANRNTTGLHNVPILVPGTGTGGIPAQYVKLLFRALQNVQE